MIKRSHIVLTILLLWGCGSPQVSFVPQAEPQGIAFHIALHNANGFLRMMVWEKDTRKTLWDINLNYYRGPVLRYGEVPAKFATYNGGRTSARQNYPKNVAPKPLPKGKDIFVYLDFQYEGFFETSASAKCYAFRLESDGTVVDLGEQPYPSRGEWPDIFNFSHD